MNTTKQTVEKHHYSEHEPSGDRAGVSCSLCTTNLETTSVDTTRAITPAQKYIKLAKRSPQYCQIQRNAILHHRSQIRFVLELYRQNKGAWNRRIIRSHIEEIRKIHAQLDCEAAMISST